MQTNLRLYHRVFQRLCQWLPSERITRQRNMALLIAGLYLGGSVHLAKVVRKWPSRSKRPVGYRLHRFLDNVRLDVRAWYEPVAANLLAGCSGHPIRLVIDSTKVGFNYRLLTI